MTQFSLSWDAYKQSICSGLSSLQQSGEFVDMTIAADGHHVKVHQMVMSLVSPYIKDLITSAQCPHPVILLNKVSHATLCSILQYIYTGEVMVANENLRDLIEAGKELRIKGLEDMKIELPTQNPSQAAMASSKSCESQSHFERGCCESKRGQSSNNIDRDIRKKKLQAEPIQEVFVNVDSEIANEDSTFDDDMDFDDNTTRADDHDTKMEDNDIRVITKKTSTSKKDLQIQYTHTNQGSLQIIVNRFIYNLRYSSKKHAGQINWRCSEPWRTSKCLASVITKDGVVIKRLYTHNHPFHDIQILKKVRDNAVFSTMDAAGVMGINKKLQRQIPKNKASDSKKKNTEIDVDDK